jgi:hypothetical protein
MHKVPPPHLLEKFGALERARGGSTISHKMVRPFCCCAMHRTTTIA